VQENPAASMPCAPVSAPRAPPQDLKSRQVRSMKTPVVASLDGDREQSIEVLETLHLDNKIMELRCGKQDKPSSTASGLGYPDSDDLTNQKVQSPKVQSLDEQLGDKLNLGQQVESAEVPET